MRECEGAGGVRGLIRTAVGRLAPDELPRFDDVWQAYLDSPRSSAGVLKSRNAPLGSGIDVIATSVAPLVIAVTGEALAGLAEEPSAPGAARRVIGRMRPAAKGRRALRAALLGPAPDPGSLEHAVLRALLLDIARKAGCPDQSAATIADTLVSAFAGLRRLAA